MQRQRQDAGPLGGREDGEAVRAGGVEGELAGPPGAGLGEAGDQAGERVVGDGEHDEVGGGDDLVGGEQRDAGQQAGGALGGGGGEAGGGDDVVSGGGERGAEDGADTAGADDAHAEAGGRGGRGGESGSADGSCGQQASCTLSFQSLAGTGRRWPPPSEAAQGSCGWCGRCGGVAPLQPDVSRGLIVDGECVTGSGPPQRRGRCVVPHGGTRTGGGGPPTVGPSAHPRNRRTAWARWTDGPPW